jgi:aldehyde:ferredoxin oxidoreductase
LVIDLDKERFRFVKLGEAQAKKMLGGRLMALTLWNSYCNYQKLKPSDYESGNPIVIAIGAASDLDHPLLDGYVLATRSPVTGSLSVTAGEGRIAKALSGVGICALVIQGRRSRITHLAITDHDVTFSTREDLHNLTVGACHALSPETPMIVIGPAAEAQVPQSSVDFDGRNLGRGGVGMVFALKNIKAITFPVGAVHVERTSYDPASLGRLSAWVEKLQSWQRKGSRLSWGNRNGWLAINGFHDRVDGRMWALEGQKPLLPLLALGPNLGVFDPAHIRPTLAACDDLGLDPFSAGVLLLWASRNGSVDPVRVLESVAYGKGPWMNLPKEMPGSFYRIGGLEMAPFDLRALPSQAVLAALGDDTIVYPALLHQKGFHSGREMFHARVSVYCQDLRYAMESLGIAYRRSYVVFNQYFPFWMIHPFALLARLASDSEGYPFSAMGIRNVGISCYRVQREINRQLGWHEPERVPDPLMTDGSSNHRYASVVTLPRLIEAYRLIRSRI